MRTPITVALFLLATPAVAQVTTADEALMQKLYLCQRYEQHTVTRPGPQSAVPASGDSLVIYPKYSIAACQTAAQSWQSTGAASRYATAKAAHDSFESLLGRMTSGARAARDQALAKQLGSP